MAEHMRICAYVGCNNQAVLAIVWGCLNLHIRDEVTCRLHLRDWQEAIPLNCCVVCQQPLEQVIYDDLPEPI